MEVRIPFEGNLAGDRDNVCVVSIYSYRSRNPVGSLYTVGNPKDLRHFGNLSEMLEIIEETVGMVNGRGTRKNATWLKRLKELAFPAKETVYQNDPVATFKINIIFRQLSSWQGVVGWSEKGRQQHFRSVTELLFLMDEALMTTILARGEKGSNLLACETQAI